MARLPYEEGQSIHSMNARQLRQYISDQATEAQERLDSSDLTTATKAFREAAGDITNARGKVARSTSYKTVPEMREMAYNLRQFNSLDSESGFAKSIDWKENKQKYQSFIRNRIAEGDDYWSKFITAKGNVSRKGYDEYKQYVEFIKSVKDIQNQYGYRTLKQYAIENMKDKNQSRETSKLLNEVFQETKGKGLTQRELIESFEMKLADMQDQKAKAAAERKQAIKTKKQIAKKASGVKAKTKKSSKSGTTVRVKTGRKMKESGKISR